MKNQVVEWLKQGGENSAADMLSRCMMEVEISGGFTTRPDGVTRKHSIVRIYAPRRIYQDLNETLAKRKYEIESAIHDCAQGNSLEVNNRIYWLPQAGTARNAEANEIKKELQK